MTTSITHKDLVLRACRWLERTKRCPLVFAEAYQNTGVELPDALGFCDGYALVVECKVSRADFRADAKKLHRLYPFLGMGLRRWYMTPPGLVKPDELPGGWGLLYAHARRVTVEKESEVFERNVVAEARWLYCVARRHRIGVRWLPSEYRFETAEEREARGCEAEAAEEAAR